MYRIILQPVAFEWRDSLHVNFVQLHVYMNIKVYSVSYLNNYIVFFTIVIVFFYNILSFSCCGKQMSPSNSDSKSPIDLFHRRHCDFKAGREQV